MQFEVKFTGSSGNLYSISDGKTMLMLECGIPWAKIQKAFGFKTSKISALLLSHEHMDHAMAIKEVAKAGIDIYLSEGTMEALGVDGHRYHIIENKRQFTVGTWTIVPFAAIHDAIEPLGFLLASGKEKALFLTDSNFVKYRFRGLTLIALAVNYDSQILVDNITCGYLNLEVGKRVLKNHMSLDTAKGFFRANDMSQVVEIYLLHLSDGNSNAEMFRSEIQAITGRPVYV